MHMMVCAVGSDLSFQFSNCGSDWKTGTFKHGIVSIELDVVRSGLVLDCLGCRIDTDQGPLWQINRDDMDAINVINVCLRICSGRRYTSTFDLTAMVAKAICDEMSYNDSKQRVEMVATETIRSFFSNSSFKKGNR